MLDDTLNICVILSPIILSLTHDFISIICPPKYRNAAFLSLLVIALVFVFNYFTVDMLFNDDFIYFATILSMYFVVMFNIVSFRGTLIKIKDYLKSR